MIDFETRIKGQSDVEEQKWAALAHIRLMNYSEAMKIYEKLVEKSDADPSLYCYLGPGFIYIVNNLKLRILMKKILFRTVRTSLSARY